MKKVLFVCDKCGKVIAKDPISIIPAVLNEDGSASTGNLPYKYAELGKMQFCSDCMDKIVACLVDNVCDLGASCLNTVEVKKAEPVAHKDREFPSLDDLMEKYAKTTGGYEAPKAAEAPKTVEVQATPVSGKSENRKRELISKLSECVVEMENKEVVEVAHTYIEEGYPAFDGIMEGLVDGMNKASALYDAEEYFVTDVLLCSDAMYAGLNVLRPHLPSAGANEKVYKVVIGVVEGDTHDIGKNLVKIMLDTAGFEVYDLGRDVPTDAFVNKAIEVGADIICMSTLMTTTMDGMRVVIDKLVKKGVRNRFKIMVGGSPLSKKYADEIGADGYTANAVDAVRLAKEFVGMDDAPVIRGM